MTWLAWYYAVTLFLLGMGWYPCCCGGITPTTDCPYCAGDGNNLACFSVTLAGVADDSCTNCEPYNGTYILGGTDTCERFALATSQCFEVSVIIEVTVNVDTLVGTFSQFEESPRSRITYFTKTYTEEETPIPCLELDTLDVPYDATYDTGWPTLVCDQSSMTFTVTSCDCP